MPFPPRRGKKFFASSHAKDPYAHQRGAAGGSHPGNCGAVFYKKADGTIGAVEADNSGSGYMILMSNGECLPPSWIDIVELINFLTGGNNVARLVEYALPIPSVSASGDITSVSGDSGSASITLPAISPSASGSANSASPASETDTVTIPTISTSASGAIV